MISVEGHSRGLAAAGVRILSSVRKQFRKSFHTESLGPSLDAKSAGLVLLEASVF